MNGRLDTKDYQTFSVEGLAVPASSVLKSRALPGDIVQLDADGTVCDILDRAPHKSIVGTLEVASKTSYGHTSRGRPLVLFRPFSRAYPAFAVGTSAQESFGKTNVLAVVDFETWDSHLPRGNCTRILGPCGVATAEEEALLIHACPHRWSRRWMEPVRPAAAPGPGAARVLGRTFHVDPPGCRDIDDALTLIDLGSGVTEVHIHIADVGSLLATNPWLWRAAAIGQTLYKDGAIQLSMFPPEVEAACSLLPFEERWTLSLVFRWEPGAGPTDLRWVQELIEVKESYTYETICGAADLAAKLRAIASDLAGQPVEDPHDWIAQLMLFYNKEAACAGAVLLRRHAAPDAERLATLERLGLGEDARALAFRAGETCFAGEADTAHWGLGAAAYCHASSPIRRWTDCINQMAILKRLGAPIEAVPAAQPAALNETARKARAYERDMFFARILLRSRVAETYEGIVVESGPEKSRLWVPAWKRLVSVRCDAGEPGTRRCFSVFCDASKPNWKGRLVVRLQSAQHRPEN